MKLVFITGASSGMGQAMAVAYLQKGWRVAVVARRVDALQAWAGQTTQQLDLGADRIGVFGADVQNPDSIVAAAEQCMAHMGLPDVVIANAGISLGVDTAEREDLAVMRRVMDTNVLGMAATFHPFIRGMQARGSGTLVGIASVAGIRGLPGHGAYCASKAGVISYCESLRGELRGSGVAVVTLSPGYIDTPLTRQNRYAMPFLMPADDFAEGALRAIEAGDSYRVIPWPMGLVDKLLRILPDGLFDRLMAGQPRKQRQLPD
jgi:NAD(P)-dependent dehydrogenase (short-subunit alcohol dehydrogenase family)